MEKEEFNKTKSIYITFIIFSILLSFAITFNLKNYESVESFNNPLTGRVIVTGQSCNQNAEEYRCAGSQNRDVWVCIDGEWVDFGRSLDEYRVCETQEFMCMSNRDCDADKVCVNGKCVQAEDGGFGFGWIIAIIVLMILIGIIFILILYFANKGGSKPATRPTNSQPPNLMPREPIRNMIPPQNMYRLPPQNYGQERQMPPPRRPLPPQKKEDRAKKYEDIKRFSPPPR